MAVRHVFAQANVAHEDQAGNFAFDGAGGLLHDAVISPGSGGDLVLFVGQAEQNYRRHAQGMYLLGLGHGFVHRQIEDAGHRTDWLADALAGAHKHGIHESVGREPGFSNQVAQFRRAAKAP
jgi:hypothetical protein